MTPVHRVVEDQAKLTSYRATQDAEKAIQLEMLIDRTKPPLVHHGWHDLIATQFRYPLPVGGNFSARFRPPGFGRNVLYAAYLLETAIYEYSYYLMRQRVHLQADKKKVTNETGTRTGFEFDVDDSVAARVHALPAVTQIMDKNDHRASHAFVTTPPPKDVICYPSVRDPRHRDALAVSDIARIAKEIKSERQLKFFYDYRRKSLHWIDLGLTIDWLTVS